MVKKKNIIAGLGVVAGLGVAMLPLGAFAEDTRSAEETVKAVVGATLNLAVSNNYAAGVTGGSDYVALTRGTENATLIHTIRVTGNTYNDYDLTMNAKTAADVDLRLVASRTEDETTHEITTTYDANNKIANIGASDTTLGDAGWGYKYAHNENYVVGVPSSFGTDYAAIPAPTAPAVLHDDTAPNATATTKRTAAYDEYHYVNFGIKAASNQVAGTYEALIEYNVTSADFI